jgi:hypothetical protein
MNRLFRFLVWLIGGIVGTLVIPLFFFGIAYLTPKTQFGNFAALICGFSFYTIVPVGFLVSIFIAFSSLRWSETHNK